MSRRNNRTASLLDPYLRTPHESSLTLLTSTLDASANWLVAQCISGALDGVAGVLGEEVGRSGDGGADAEGGDGAAVVLVSWMRDWEGWRGEVRRGGGLDLARLAQRKRFAFVDGLSSLFGSSAAPEAADRTTATPNRRTAGPLRAVTTTASIPNRGPLPIRQLPGPTVAATTTPDIKPPPHTQTPNQNGTLVLENPTLANLHDAVTAAISALAPAPIHLILDSPDLLLASESTVTTELYTCLMRLRSVVHSTTLVCAADPPLLRVAPDASGAGLLTPLEEQQAAFVLQAAHQARWVLSVRGLDTGVAKDVSGVVRVTKGGGWEEGGVGADGMEMEALYYVQADGGVRVFERGGGSVG
ncbi:hypothetical protein LTR28_000091 [Elasticomyces elasticus]|nr:hypothetical protein LTR28_000091 [Elasticomyces elasticus]